MQKLVYSTVGKEFYTYGMFFIICVCLATAVYFLFFKYRVKSKSQYFWLFLCAGVYIYYAATLRKYPEEALHFVEYGLLSYFLFRALSAKIHDKTIYITALILVAVTGAFDEFLQWMMPGRYWDYRDVGFNSIAGLVFLVAVWKAIRPEVISGPVKRYSLKLFALALTANLIFLGICLSNTPDMVKRYASPFPAVKWLLSEEPMTEFGYKHMDETGTFYSRMTLEEIRRIDLEKGEEKGNALKLNAAFNDETGELMNTHTPYTDRFLFEFLMHLIRRDEKIGAGEETVDQDEKVELFNKAYRENFILEKYFGFTLKHSEMVLSDEKVRYLHDQSLSSEKEYVSIVGRIITSVDLKAAWLLILGILTLVWVPLLLRKKGPG